MKKAVSLAYRGSRLLCQRQPFQLQWSLWDKVGSIAAGKKNADFVVCDEQLNPKSVYLERGSTERLPNCRLIRKRVNKP